MCGILFRLSQNLLNDKQQIWKNLIENVSKRGPDFQKEITLQTIKKQNLNFYSSILNLRGDKNHPTAQPLEDNAENLLMFNGEIFDGVNVANNENDAFKLSVELSNVNGNKNKSNISDYVEVMGRVRGPFSFLFLHKKLNFLLFGRDVLGRRSLLWNLNELKNNESDEFLITSVGTEGSKYQEVPANGFYCLDLNGLDCNKLSTISNYITLYPWNNQNNKEEKKDNFGDEFSVAHFSLELPFRRLNQLISPEDYDIPLNVNLERFYNVLSNAVKVRVETIPSKMPHHPRLGILFSGGLDCMSLAAIANSYIPEGEPIDLFNVAFENPRALKGIAVTLKNSQQQKKKKTKLDKKLKYLAKQAGNIPINPNSITEVTEEYQFNIYDVPDRVTARQGLQELKTRFPQRPWQLVEIDVPYTEAVESKKKVLELASPSASVMDLSIAIAFWFAAKGVGRKISITGDVTEMYTSPVKVLFSGLGADEQLGGYRRHRGSYESNGWQGLVDELQLDVDRIATRNLGRDDRVISDHAKEVRFPFLDEKVIDFLSSLPCFVKSNPTVKEGLGDKILLRSLALDDRLGPLTLTAKEPKRAIQFGARTAKMHDKKEKGDDLADNSD